MHLNITSTTTTITILIQHVVIISNSPICAVHYAKKYMWSHSYDTDTCIHFFTLTIQQPFLIYFIAMNYCNVYYSFYIYIKINFSDIICIALLSTSLVFFKTIILAEVLAKLMKYLLLPKRGRGRINDNTKLSWRAPKSDYNRSANLSSVWCGCSWRHVLLRRQSCCCCCQLAPRERLLRQRWLVGAKQRPQAPASEWPVLGIAFGDSAFNQVHAQGNHIQPRQSASLLQQSMGTSVCGNFINYRINKA